MSNHAAAHSGEALADCPTISVGEEFDNLHHSWLVSMDHCLGRNAYLIILPHETWIYFRSIEQVALASRSEREIFTTNGELPVPIFGTKTTSVAAASKHYEKFVRCSSLGNAWSDSTRCAFRSSCISEAHIYSWCAHCIVLAIFCVELCRSGLLLVTYRPPPGRTRYVAS
jgi:hypothetical protein